MALLECSQYITFNGMQMQILGFSSAIQAFIEILFEKFAIFKKEKCTIQVFRVQKEKLLENYENFYMNIPADIVFIKLESIII